MVPATVLGAVVGQISGAAGVLALCPAGAYAGDDPLVQAVPPSIVLQDAQENPKWLTTAAFGSWREERHKVTAQVYAADTNTVDAQNPADELANAVEAAVNWDDLNLTGTLTIGLPRQTRSQAIEVKKSPSGERVFKVALEWLVVLSCG